MACYYPITAWYSKHTNPTGKRSLVFNDREALQPDDPIQVACGKCIGCRLERSRQWAMRCVHEASLYDDNCFITLTYDDEHLPKDFSVNKKHLQNFWKEIRNDGHKFRYFACGEYGDLSHRPHYHAIMFNFDFPDKELWKISQDNRLYVSEYLNAKWRKGYAVIGDVTFDSAAYVARYVMKKQEEYEKDEQGNKTKVKKYLTDEVTGTTIPVEHEFTTQSRRPGIGYEWYKKFKTDAYPSDFITVNGKKMKPPKFYDRKFEEDNPFEMDFIKNNRLEFAKDNQETMDRLRTKEKLKRIKTKKLIRPDT
jgi:hypothetical protein